MTLSPSNPRAKGRWLFLGALVATLMLTVVALTLAVHDLEFQLDGDVSASTTTIVGGSTQNLDWDSFFDANGDKVLPLPTGFDAAGFDQDFVINSDGSFNTSDASTYATGSKDTLPISPGWQCNRDNNVNAKIDIMNAYAASYTNSDDEEILYFALERNANTGDANVGFWFLQDDVDCVSPGGNTPFTGNHMDGDLLAVSAFSKGGGLSTINVYRWDGGAEGSLNPNPVAQGVSCKTTTGGDDVCGATNSGPNAITGTITTPWLTSNKQDGVGHTLRIAEFFEGGINLTQSDLGGKCFNVFIGDTRSSTSLTATLFDFSRGQLGSCDSGIDTTPMYGDGETPITSEPIPATGQLLVTDSADITVTGADTFDATVTFYLCRETELVDADGLADPDGTCATGGTQIGDPKAVTSSSTVVSDPAGLTAAERYCWRGEFSGDEVAGVPSETDSSAGECFVVTPLQPILTTDASDDVTLNDPIYDTISLTGTADQPGTDGIGPGGTIDATDRAAAAGTISFTAYGPDDCTTVAHSGTINVSGDNTAYGGSGSATEFTPTAIGEYTYVASYSGNLPNTLDVDETACPDLTGAEVVTVTGEAGLSTAQDWLPNDTATVTGPINLNGTLTFTLYNDATCGDDDGTVEYTEEVTVSDASSNSEFSTDNTTFTVTATGSWSWLVSYADDNLAAPDASCETTDLTIDNG